MSGAAYRRLVVEADGGSRGNPGVAGYGALVRDPQTGAILARRAAPLGMASNNVAEYTGLIVGLETAAALAPGASIEARLDSKLVVEQLSGRWKVKHEDMRRLALQARAVVRGIEAAGGQVRFTWVPREENTDADALSNEAMDGKTVVWDAQAKDLSGERRVAPPDLGSPTRIILVRHGVTPFTVDGRLDGRGGADPSLTAEGRAQAAAAGLGVAELVDPAETVVLTSALARAKETGRAVADALGVDPVEDSDWDEQGFGDWDGIAMRDLMAGRPEELRRFRDDPTHARPGGESHEELTTRVLAAYRRGVARGGTVVIATHRKPIMVVLAEVLGLAHDKIWVLATAPASLTAVQVWQDGTVNVAFVNRTAHLDSTHR